VNAPYQIYHPDHGSVEIWAKDCPENLSKVNALNEQIQNADFDSAVAVYEKNTEEAKACLVCVFKIYVRK
jgi:hypothetical protein